MNIKYNLPYSSTYLKALSINPPLHPWFPTSPEQSTNYYSLNSTKFPVLMKCIPSKAPVVENAQQDPH